MNLSKVVLFFIFFGAAAAWGATDSLLLDDPLTWRGQAVGQVLAEPSPDAWVPASPIGYARLTYPKSKSAPFKDIVKEAAGVWKETSFAVPSSWKNRFVRMVLGPMHTTDAIVFVNGQKAGEILRPAGDLDVSALLRGGETNTVRIYYTISGEGTQHGPWRIGRWFRHFADPGPASDVRLTASDGAQITDVFADTRVRGSQIHFELEIQAPRDTNVKTSHKVTVQVFAPDGTRVQMYTDSVFLKPGVNTFSLGGVWENPVYWELGRPFLYTAKVALETGDTQTIRFGFREIWRDGKNLVMNNHPLHLRPCFAYRPNRYGAEFLRDIGYNTLTYNHNSDAFPLFPSEEMMNAFDELGMGFFCSSGNIGNIAGDHFNKDPVAAEQLRTFVKTFHRLTRNHPSLVACYVTQMIICNISFGPEVLGQSLGGSDRDDLINKAREINRVWNPNILYYSHADGANGDMSSGNMYLNWTPLQEREEWLSQWKTNGVIPWHGAEFGQPYMGCWYDRRGLFVGSEHLAQYFGDRAFTDEPADVLAKVIDAGSEMPSGHGSDIGHAMIQRHPLYRELERLFVWRTNSRWRADGLNGGNLWFNRQGYGSEQYGPYGQNSLILTKSLQGKRPEWASPAYDAYRLGNLDFCGYLGGYPAHYDKTHAYRAGEEIRKQAVFIWDGGASRPFTCDWQLRPTGNAIARPVLTGRVQALLVPGHVAFQPVSFAAPAVLRKTDYELILTFRDADREWFTDRMALEVYPARDPAMSVAPETRLALFDPQNADGDVLSAEHLEARKILNPDEIGSATHLIIAKNAADQFPLTALARAVRNGLKVLILPQKAETWQAFGLRPMDVMARKMWLRDKTNPAYAELSEDSLACWRGAPRYGTRTFGPVMSHTAQRGPRWTRNHVVAGLALEIPSAIGYTPVIDGEFDMNYAAVLRFAVPSGGSVTYCTLDFEDRLPADPAASAVARAVLSDFLRPPQANPSAGARLVLDAADTTPWKTIRSKAEAGAVVLVKNNARLAREAGFDVSAPTEVRRASVPAASAFRCTGPALWRWNDRLDANLLSRPPAGFTVEADGLVASGLCGRGSVTFVMVPEGQLAARYEDEASAQACAAKFLNWMGDAYAQLFVELGAASKTTNIHRRDIAQRYRGVRNEWYDRVTRDSFERFRPCQAGGQSNLFIRTISGRRIQNEGKWVRWQNYTNEVAQGHAFLIVHATDEILSAIGVKTVQKSIREIPAVSFGGVNLPALDLSALGGLTLPAVTQAPAGFELYAEGLLAVGRIGPARVIISAFDQSEIETDAKYWKNRARTCAFTEERIARLYARIQTNLGFDPGWNGTRRALYQAGVASFRPLPAVYVLGPFATGKDNEEIIDKVWCPEGEKMALAGDFNPNIEFPLPQGGTCNWRPTLAPDANGLFNLQTLNALFERASFPCSYSIAVVNRRRAGPALLKFGVDWRAKVWCNGKLVFATQVGSQYPKFEIKLDLKEGANILTFKVGSGRTSNKFWALLEGESSGPVGTAADPALDAMLLYTDKVSPAFDPYEFSFW